MMIIGCLPCYLCRMLSITENTVLPGEASLFRKADERRFSITSLLILHAVAINTTIQREKRQTMLYFSMYMHCYMGIGPL